MNEKIYMAHAIPLDAIIVFPQVRKSFDKTNLQELADDIAQNGVLQPSIVGRLTLDSFITYKEVFEKISNTKLPSLNVFPFLEENGSKFYYPLIAGERRYRAHMILWTKGCTECQQEASLKGINLLAGQCYVKHFGSNTMEVRACNNIEPVTAKSAQFRENNYVKPPIHEEAYAYQDFYDYLKLANPKMNHTAFAATVGISVEKVRKALLFCDLPEKARKAVEKKIITFSNSVELQKIMQYAAIEECHRQKMVDYEIEYLMMHPRIKQKDYRDRINDLLQNAIQPTLFNPDDFILTKKQKRRVVENYLIPYFTTMAGYFLKIKQLQEDGVIGKGKLYSGGSPTRQMHKMLNQLQLLIPGFYLTSKQKQKILEVDFEKMQSA